jgi:hypothetical protein
VAQGDVTLFNEFKEDLGLKIHNLETDTFKVGLVTNSVTPAATSADPRWGAGGSTNFSSNQVTPGGNYTTGGPTIANNTYVETAGVAAFDGDNISVLQNASNPTNARWGIIYNDTSAGKEAVGFLDLGSVFDLSSGDLTVTWAAAGIFTGT